MSAHRTEDDFLDSIGRLASDHAKRSDARQQAEKTAAEDREHFLRAFADKARNEIEPALERVAERVESAGRATAGVTLNETEDEVKLRVFDQSTERHSELQFRANPLKRRVTVHEGSAELRTDRTLSDLRVLQQEGGEIVATLTLEQLDQTGVRSRVEQFLRKVLS
jgi:hypothetical protein